MGIGCLHTLNCMKEGGTSFPALSHSPHLTLAHTHTRVLQLDKKKNLWQEKIGCSDVIVAVEVLLGNTVCREPLCNFLTNTRTCL